MTKLIFYKRERVIDDRRTGAAIRKYRKLHSVRQAVLAKELGFTQPMLCGLELGTKYHWSEELVVKATKAINELIAL